MIKHVYLFTNRNLMVFDEKGEQVIDIQKAIGWNHEPCFENVGMSTPISHFISCLIGEKEKERSALKKIIEHDPPPAIYIAKFREWAEPITIDELCSLLGHGPWYWENYKTKEIVDKKIQEETQF